MKQTALALALLAAAGCATLQASIDKWNQSRNSWDTIRHVNLSEYGLIVGRAQATDTRTGASDYKSSWPFETALYPNGNDFYSKGVCAGEDGYFAWAVPAGRYESKKSSLVGGKSYLEIPHEQFSLHVTVQPGQVVYVGDVKFTIVGSGFMTATVHTVYANRQEEMLQILRQRLGEGTFSFSSQLVQVRTREFPPTSSLATAPPAQPQASAAPAGGGEEPPVVAETGDRYVEEKGLAQAIKKLLLGWEAEGVRNRFPLSTGKIIWFGRLTDAGLIRDSFRPAYRVQWYAPDGALFAERTFRPSHLSKGLLETALEYDPTLGEQVVGRWRVRVTRKGEVVDERMFQVVGEKTVEAASGAGLQ